MKKNRESAVRKYSRCGELLAALALVAVSYVVIFRGYERPAGFVWDESYHIASAQKYLNGIYFMELHPPLGKLVIAAGEWLLDSNLKDDQFINPDHATDLPKAFSFVGYRFFPVLFATLCPLLMFLSLRVIGVHVFFSTLGASLLLFYNSFVAHVRAAMLEGTQLFFPFKPHVGA